MITGVVKADEGRIRLKVKGPRGRERAMDSGKQADSPRRSLVCKASICYGKMTFVFGRSGSLLWLQQC
jgi:hypothetical protein